MRFGILAKLMTIMLALTVVPLAILGYLALQDARDIGNSAANNAESMGNKTIDSAGFAVTQIVSDSFIKLGNKIAEDVVGFLEDREKDTVFLASIASQNDPASIQELFASFQREKTSKIWYNTNTDFSPAEKTEYVPLYSEIVFIDASGREVVRMMNGLASPELRDVSKIENTEFKSEDYFAKAHALGPGEVYVSRLNTWYLTEAEARKTVPESEKDNKAWNIVPGRDTMKSGNIKFASPVYEGSEFKGVVVLSLDYRHVQELTKHIDPAIDHRVVSTSYEGNYILFFDDEGNTIVHPKPNNIRGFLPDGRLEHTNTVAAPGGIFNVKDYDKGTAYKELYAKAIAKQPLVQSATDVQGRTKMTITVPVLYDKGEYKDAGIFGGIMMSVNTDRFYETTRQTEDMIKSDIAVARQTIKESTEGMQTQNTIFMVTFLTIVIVIFASYFFAKSITMPIQKLKDVADRVVNGDLNAEMPTAKTKDEVMDLTAAMEMLVSGFKSLKAKEQAPKTGDSR